MSWTPHITVAAVVPDGERYLLVEEMVSGRPVFNQPAGHLDPGETLAEAAIRETLEETGYRIRLSGVLGLYQWTCPRLGEHFLRTTFIGEVVERVREAELDAGIIAAHWLAGDEIRRLNGRLRNPLVLRNIDDYERRGGFPLELLESLDR